MVEAESRRGSEFGKNLRLLLRDKFALIGIIVYVLAFTVALFANQLAPFDPQEILFTENGKMAANLSPTAEHPLGTTNLGRDIYSQLVISSRSALIVGLTAAFFVVVVGSLVGVISGFFGGWVDVVLMRVTDVAFGIPFLPFVIVLAAFLKPSIWNVVIAMALILWRDTARVIRAQVLSLRERQYVEAARALGSGPLRIMFTHIVPNVTPMAFLYGSIAIGWAILTEASVSFLGFGDPTVMSWGFMLQDAYSSQALSRGAFYWFVPPGVAIVLLVTAGFFISRGYEEVLMPRLKE